MAPNRAFKTPTVASQRQRKDEWSFLVIPGEVRARIYSFVVDDVGAILHYNNKIVVRSSLSRTCKQIHGEMQDEGVKCLTIQIKEFNFGKVVWVLNKLEEWEVARLREPEKRNTGNSRGANQGDGQKQLSTSTHSSDGERDDNNAHNRVIIELDFKPYGRDLGNSAALLDRWLIRFKDPEKRGMNIAFEYRCINYDFSALNEYYSYIDGLQRRRRAWETVIVCEHIDKIHEVLRLAYEEAVEAERMERERREASRGMFD